MLTLAIVEAVTERPFALHWLHVEQVLSDVDATLAGDPLSGFAPLEELVPDAQELSNYTDTTS